jgi:hypothetical protein
MAVVRCPTGRNGSYLAVGRTLGGGSLLGVKLKKQDQELTLALEGRLAPGKRSYPAAASSGQV